MVNEEIYIEKKIVCQKCGHVHEFSLKASLSVNNFVVDGYCIACGAAITVDRNTIFKNTHINVGVPVIPSSPGLEVMESNSDTSNNALLPDVMSFFDESDSSGSSHSTSSSLEDTMKDMFE